MSLINGLRSVVGVPPVGFEFVEYIVMSIVFLYIVSAIISLFTLVAKTIKGD